MDVFRAIGVIAMAGYGSAVAAKPPDTLAFYPPAARAAGVEGRAMLSCRINKEGRVEACRVVSEEPAGHGFGEAAIGLSEKFRMNPRRGPSPAGATVQIPVSFKLPPKLD